MSKCNNIAIACRRKKNMNASNEEIALLRCSEYEYSKRVINFYKMVPNWNRLSYIMRNFTKKKEEKRQWRWKLAIFKTNNNHSTKKSIDICVFDIETKSCTLLKNAPLMSLYSLDWITNFRFQYFVFDGQPTIRMQFSLLF